MPTDSFAGRKIVKTVLRNNPLKLDVFEFNALGVFRFQFQLSKCRYEAIDDK